MKSKSKHIGRYLIFQNGKQIAEFTNMIMRSALNEQAKLFTSTAPTNLEIKYLALGYTTDTSLSNSDTKLKNELFRTLKTSQSIFQSTQYTGVETQFYISASDLNITNITEWGIFSGSSAVNTKDSGIMISRTLWDYFKPDQTELNIVRIDEFY